MSYGDTFGIAGDYRTRAELELNEEFVIVQFNIQVGCVRLVKWRVRMHCWTAVIIDRFDKELSNIMTVPVAVVS